jgi:hypothetical protein
MPQLFIDGLVQEVEDDDPRIGRSPGTVVETSEENFRAASVIYGQSRKIKRLGSNPDFIVLMDDLKEQVQSALDSWAGYLGPDEKKRERLSREYQHKKLILIYLINIVAEAENMPRPILQQQET